MWFAGLIFLALLLFIGIFFQYSSDLLIFALAPTISSFIIGGRFGLKLLVSEQLSHKELLTLGIKIPIYSALLALIVSVFLYQIATIYDLLAKENEILVFLSVLVILPIPLLIGGIIAVILPLSPFICISGILGAFLLNYLSNNFINFINRNN